MLKAYKSVQNLTLEVLLNDIDEKNNKFYPCKMNLEEFYDSYDSDEEIINQDIRKAFLDNIRKQKRNKFLKFFLKQVYYNHIVCRVYI